MRLHDLPENLRPRERLLRHGPTSLSEAELLALIIATGTPKANAVTLATHLLSWQDLNGLSRTTLSELQHFPGIGLAKASAIIAHFELARRQKTLTAPSREEVHSTTQLAQLYTTKLCHLDKEQLIALYLNARNHIIEEEVISIGTVNASLLHPREVFKPAIRESATALILVHNHPSGSPLPSDSDLAATEQIALAGEVLGIPLLDHIIVSDTDFFSFRKNNLL